MQTAPPNVAKPQTAASVGWPARLGVLGISSALYLAACAAPALFFSNGKNSPMPGFVVLLGGWLGLFVGEFAWLANFVLPVAWVLLLCRRWIAAAVASLFALLVGLHTFALFGKQIPKDEGGTGYMHLVRVEPGGYLWLASIAALAVGALVLMALERRKRVPTEFAM